MKIVIDLQACQSDSRFRGIGRYSMSLAKAIARQAGDHEIWIALSDRFPDTIPGIRDEFGGLVPKDRIAVFAVNGPVAENNPNNLWRTRTAEKIREYFLAELQPDIVHVTSLFEGIYQDVVTSIGAFNHNLPTVVTLHDLIPFIYQDTYLPDKQSKDFYFRKIQWLKNADLLLAVSDYSKHEAVTALGINPGTIINCSEAVDEHFTPRKIKNEQKRAVIDRYKITKPFIMYAPGGYDERKNIPRLLKAYSRLNPGLRKTHQLVITSKCPESVYIQIINLVKATGLKENELILTGYVPDEDLIALYNLCKLFVFPSLYEGFGLPALEAMACGAVVIASNTTSIPEVIGRADALFDPTHTEAITAMMQHALTDEGFRQSLRDHGLEQAKKFSWNESAKKTIATFEELHHERVSNLDKNYPGVEVTYNHLISSISNVKTTKTPTNLDLLGLARCIAFNNPPFNTRQLLVDISELVHRDAKSGIQRVVRSILLELLSSPPQGYLVKPIYFDDQNYVYANRFVNKLLGNKGADLDDKVVDVARDDIFLGLDLSAHITSAAHDYHKRLNILGINLFFIIYDILPAKHPEWWPQGMNKMIVQWLKSIAEVSTGLICISRSVADEVQNWLDAHPSNREEPLQIGYFHLGADIKNSAPTTGMPDDASFVLAALETAPTFLMVGTLEPRKGHAQALSAFEILWEEGLEVNLVIVGKRGWLVEDLIDQINNHPMLGRHLFWLDGISDEYLEKVYAASTCLLAPSEGEGFGLPLIEAAQNSLPIIARDIPVFREVANDHAIYFKAFSPEKLAKEIKEWLKLYAKGNVPDSADIPWLTWRESALQLLESMKIYSTDKCKTKHLVEKCSIKHNTTNDNQEKSMADNNITSPSLPLPNGVSETELFEFITSIRVVDAPENEMRSYATEDFRRFVYTWGLAKNISGKCLELGANPYFTTFLLKEFSNLELHLANYFGVDSSGIQSQSVKYQDFKTKRNAILDLSYQHFNVEKDSFPYSNNLFDLVIFSEIIEHLLYDPCFVLREINRVLKPGGVMYFTFDPVWTADSGSHFIQLIKEPWLQLIKNDQEICQMIEYNGGTESDINSYLNDMNRLPCQYYEQNIPLILKDKVILLDLSSWSGCIKKEFLTHINRKIASEKFGYDKRELLIRGYRLIAQKSF